MSQSLAENDPRLAVAVKFLQDHGCSRLICDYTMAANDWSATTPFLLKSDMRLSMAIKYWYTFQTWVFNNDLRFLVLCSKIELEYRAIFQVLLGKLAWGAKCARALRPTFQPLIKLKWHFKNHPTEVAFLEISNKTCNISVLGVSYLMGMTFMHRSQPIYTI